MPQPPDQRQADALDRSWDVLFRGDPIAPETQGLDPDLAVALERVHTLNVVPPVDPVFASRLWEELMHTHATADRLLSPPDRPPMAASPILALPLRPTANVTVPAMPRSRWPWGHLATAALLLLTLVSVVVLGRIRSAPDEPSRSLSALVAAPTPAVSLETRFAATLPAAMFPTAPGDRTFNAWHAVLDPGAREAITGGIPGPQITYVVDGELTLRVDGPLAVYRGTQGGSKAEAVSSGTEVILAPGDTAVYAYETPAEYANTGSTPVHVVGGELGIGVVPGRAVPLTTIDYGEKYPLPALPPGPVQVTLVHATLAPDGLVPAPPLGSVSLAVGADAEISLGENGDGSLRNILPREITVYILSFVPLGSPASALTT
jgi:hypothetical protein